jgi:hypothetical protein
VAELQEPPLGQDLGVGVGGGGVDADEVGGELVDPDGVLVEVTLQGGEGGAAAEPGAGKPLGASSKKGWQKIVVTRRPLSNCCALLQPTLPVKHRTFR